MKKNLTYNEAYSEIEKIVSQIENEEIQLDILADKVKQAKELIEFCENRLRQIETEVQKAINNG
jgi:exodeoxyribonuclease VII small subunit